MIRYMSYHPKIDLMEKYRIKDKTGKSASHYSYSQGKYQGTFKILDLNTLHTLIVDNEQGKKYALLENVVADKFIHLAFDLDFKDKPKYVSFKKYLIVDIIDGLIKIIINSIHTLFDGCVVSYIYADKNIGNGVHLYFPNIILSKVCCLALRSLIIETVISSRKFKKIDDNLWNDVFDARIYKTNGLRLLYCVKDEGYYKVNLEKSTYSNLTNDKIQHLELAKFKVVSDHIDNIKYVLDDKGGFLYLFYVTKKILEKEKAITNENNYDDSDYELDEIPVDKNVFIKLCENLSPDRLTKNSKNKDGEVETAFDKWMQFNYICRNHGLKDICIQFSDGKQNTIKIINNIFRKPSKKQINIKTLSYWSHQDNPEKHKLIMSNKLVMNHSDEYLLYGYRDKEFYTENSKYVSNEAINHMNKEFYDTIILFSGTGTGKTTAIMKIINHRYTSEMLKKTSILSIISRMTMITTHKKALPDLELNDYLTCKYAQNHYICSLESLSKINENYEILILDETTSLLGHFYSATMDNRRADSFFRLVQLIKNCELIIMCDANITSMTLAIIYDLRPDVFIYRNMFKTKDGVPMINYSKYLDNKDHKKYLLNYLGTRIEKFNTDEIKNKIMAIELDMKDIEAVKQNIKSLFKSKIDKEEIDEVFESIPMSVKHGYLPEDDLLEFIAMRIVENWKVNKSGLIVSDSKTVCLKLYNILKNYIDSKDIFLFTSDIGTLNELNNFNENYKDKVVIASPRIVFGFDILIHYDFIFAIYKSLSINSLAMIQQIGRARICKGVEMIFLNDGFCNFHVSFETHKMMENRKVQNFVNDMSEKNRKKFGAEKELCIRWGNDNIKMDKKRPFTLLHYFKSWFDVLFGGRKSQAVTTLSTEMGFVVTDKNVSFIESKHEKLGKLKKDLNKYIINVNKEVIDKIKKDYKKPVLNITDDDVKNKDENNAFDLIKSRIAIDHHAVVRTRMKIIGVTKEILLANPELCDVIADEKRFKKYINSQYLYLSFEKLENRQLNNYYADGIMITKDDKIYRKLKTLDWLENLFGVKDKFYIEQINVADDEIAKLKEELTKKVADIMLFKEGIEDNRRLKKRLLNTISKINKNDQLQKFMADIYNSYDDIVTYQYKQREIKGIKMGHYNNWGLNNELMKLHKLSN